MDSLEAAATLVVVAPSPGSMPPLKLCVGSAVVIRTPVRLNSNSAEFHA